MARSKQNCTVTNKGTTYVDVSTPKHQSATMLCDDWVWDQLREAQTCGWFGRIYASSGKNGKSYAVANSTKVNGINVTVLIHRFIIGGDPEMVDHIDGDGLNNLASNLRPATAQQNTQNRCTSSCNTSGYKGVSWHKPSSLWQAYIGVNGARFTIGYYKDKERAAAAYNEAATKNYGEFARVNQI